MLVQTFLFVAMALCLDAAFAGERMNPGNDPLTVRFQKKLDK
jgi:hypothetical protein